MKNYKHRAWRLLLTVAAICCSSFSAGSAATLQEVLITSLSNNPQIEVTNKRHEILKLQNYADLVDTILPRVSLYANSSFISSFQGGQSFEEFLSPVSDIINTLLEEDKTEDDRQIACASIIGYKICFLTINKAKGYILDLLGPTREESKKRLRDLSQGFLNYGKARDSSILLPLELGVNFSWDLMSVPTMLMKNEILSEKQQASKAIISRTIQQEAAKTINIYLELAFLHQKITLHKQELAYTQKLLDRAEQLAQSGVISTIDLNLAKLQLLAAQEKLLTSLADMEIVEEDYNLQIGSLPKQIEIPLEPELPKTLADALLQLDLFNSDLADLLHQINAAGKEANLAAINIAPRLNLEANLSKGWDLKNNTSSDLRWSVGVNINIELLGSASQTYWSRTTSLKERAMLLAKHRSLRQELHQEMAEAWFKWLSLQQKYELAKQRLAIEEQILANKEEKFAKGLINLEQLVESFLQAAQTRAAVIDLKEQRIKYSFKIIALIGNMNFAKAG